MTNLKCQLINKELCITLVDWLKKEGLVPNFLELDGFFLPIMENFKILSLLQFLELAFQQITMINATKVEFILVNIVIILRENIQ